MAVYVVVIQRIEGFAAFCSMGAIDEFRALRVQESLLQRVVHGFVYEQGDAAV